MLDHPFFSCGFRPFFFAGALHAVFMTLYWGAGYAFFGGMPTPPGGPAAWHGQEMIFGFAVAALCGFLLTAVPEFTGTPSVSRGRLVFIFALWCGGRLAAWGSALPFVTLNAAFDTGVVVLLICYVARPLVSAVQQRGLLYALISLLAVALGYQAARLFGGDPLAWLRAALHLFTIFIVLALRRIGMRIVNRALEAGDSREQVFLPRPPATRIAVFAIALHGLAEITGMSNAIVGWLALAAAAGILNLMNDWHVGRALFRRWVLLLYGILWMLALGYLGAGLSLLCDAPPLWLSGARHLLAIGGVGLSVFVVFTIAGRSHSGYDLDERPWVPISAALIVCATLMRVAFSMHPHRVWILASALAWSVAFGTYLIYFGRILFAPRPDGEVGC